MGVAESIDAGSWLEARGSSRPASMAAQVGIGPAMSVHSDRPVIVGGGIVGLATALALAERGRQPIVVEAEDTIASHQTGHNSGVIHSGLYYKPGSSKARLCKAGVDAMYQFCAEENIPHRRTGKLVIATDDAEM